MMMKIRIDEVGRATPVIARRLAVSLAPLALAFALSACENANTTPPAKPPVTTTGGGDADHDHDDGHMHADGEGHESDDHGHDHDHDEGQGHDADPHGPTVELGEQSAGGFTVRASRDGDVTPGNEAPVDVWVTGGGGKVSAVRFWIGTADGKGSMKAKAELERDAWHTHVEVPSPLPSGSQLWVEIENERGERTLASFNLNA
jgi:hypothetical protein